MSAATEKADETTAAQQTDAIFEKFNYLVRITFNSKSLKKTTPGFNKNETIFFLFADSTVFRVQRRV